MIGGTYDNHPLLRRDPVRPGKRLRVRVDVIPMATSIPGVPTRVPSGVQEVVIHALDLEAVEARVEDRMDALATAEQLTENARREFVCEKTRTPRAELPDDPEDWTERQRKAGEGFNLTNTMAEFRRIVGRDMRALRSVEVVEELPGEVSRDVELASQIVERMSGNGAPGLAAELSAMRAKIEELESELARRRGGRPRKSADPDTGNDGER